VTSKLIRGTALDGQIRFFVTNTTNMVEDAKTIHQTSPVATAALGRLLTATSILGVMLKGENNKVTARIHGNGPIGTMIATSNATGNVKGYVGNPLVLVDSPTKGKLNVGGAVGTDGEITIIKDLGMKNSYISNYPLVSGEIGEDFAAYFMHSEQTPSAVGLGVIMDVDYTIKSAGGFIIQLMPETDENVAFIIEERIKEIGSVSELFAKSKNEKEVLEELLGPFAPEIMKEYEIAYHCDCHRERFEKALISLGKDELSKILDEDGHAELQCHFCNKTYQFNQENLKSLIRESK